MKQFLRVNEYWRFSASFLFTAFIGSGNFLFSQTPCAPGYSFSHLDKNNVDALLQQSGTLWWDLNESPGYEVPKGEGVNSIFAGSIWLAGIDEYGQLKVAAQTYRQTGNDFFPGPLDQYGLTTTDQCTDFDRHWKINRSTIDSFILGIYGSAIPSSIKEWPGKNNPHLSFLPPDQNLAPFIDVNTDGKYNPADGDYPDIYGDQSIWWVFNDNGNIHSESGGIPMQVEVQTQAFSYKCNCCLNDVTFYEYKLINKSAYTIDSFFFGHFLDYDLGCHVDDYLGSDSSRSMVVVYNADAEDGNIGCDADYGFYPPMIALRFLRGPDDKFGNSFRMNSAIYYNNDGTATSNPNVAHDYYTFLNAHWKDDEPLTYGGDGYGGTTPVKFVFSSDPSDENGWSQCADNHFPYDNKVIMASGPFVFDPEEVLTFFIAVIFDQSYLSYTPCPSFEKVREAADCTKDYFDLLVGTSEEHLLGTGGKVDLLPNPVSDELSIEFPHTDNWEVTFTDNLGRVVYQLRTAFLKEMIMPVTLESGIYLVTSRSRSGVTFTGKILVL